MRYLVVFATGVVRSCETALFFHAVTLAETKGKLKAAQVLGYELGEAAGLVGWLKRSLIFAALGLWIVGKTATLIENRGRSGKSSSGERSKAKDKSV